MNLLYILLSFWIPYFGFSMLFYNRKDLESYHLCWRVVLFNTLVIFPILSSIALKFIQVTHTNFNGFHCSFQLLTNVTCFEVFFYLLHRMFHHPFFYKFHKLHHIFVSTIAFGGLYAHPIDFICTNYLPGSFGFLLLSLFFDIHLYTVMIWSMLAATYVTISHGIDNFHSNHHKLFLCNFGTLGIMDKMFGTCSR